MTCNRNPWSRKLSLEPKPGIENVFPGIPNYKWYDVRFKHYIVRFLKTKFRLLKMYEFMTFDSAIDMKLTHEQVNNALIT